MRGHGIEEVRNDVKLPRPELLEHLALQRLGDAGDRVGTVEAIAGEAHQAQVGSDEREFRAMQRGHEFRRALAQNPHGQGSRHRMRYGGVNMDQVELRFFGHRGDLGGQGQVVHRGIGGGAGGRIDHVLAHPVLRQVRRARTVADEMNLVPATGQIAGQRRGHRHRRRAEGRSDHSNLHIGNT